MGNLTKTLKTQVVDFLGPSPSTKWLSFKWTAAGVGPGNGTWGMKSAACMGTSSIQKRLFRILTGSNSVGVSCPTANVFKRLTKTWTKINSILPSAAASAWSMSVGHYLIWTKTNVVSPIYANSNKQLTSGGYTYIFPGPTSNIEQEASVTYNSAPAASTTWTSAAVISTTWT